MKNLKLALLTCLTLSLASGAIAQHRHAFIWDSPTGTMNLAMLGGNTSAAPDCDTLSFRSGGVYVTGGQPLNIVTAELNRDNKLDFVLANAAGLVVVYYGDGRGRFTGPNNFAAGVYPHNVAVGDSIAMAFQTWRWPPGSMGMAPAPPLC